MVFFNSDNFKSTQSSMIDTEAIEELLDTMNVYMKSDYLQDPDVLSHPLWDHIMMVCSLHYIYKLYMAQQILKYIQYYMCYIRFLHNLYLWKVSFKMKKQNQEKKI